jgi:hypothetical protein
MGNEILGRDKNIKYPNKRPVKSWCLKDHLQRLEMSSQSCRALHILAHVVFVAACSVLTYEFNFDNCDDKVKNAVTNRHRHPHAEC